MWASGTVQDFGPIDDGHLSPTVANVFVSLCKIFLDLSDIRELLGI